MMGKPDFKSEESDHLIVTIHGIRTFGHWQERLEKLVTGRDPQVEVCHYKFGYFSLIAFLIPLVRRLVVIRFRRRFLRLCGQREWKRIDIVAHSFGTHIAAWGIKGLRQEQRPEIHTMILAGSVLRSEFDWSQLLGRGVRRVVNDCGVKDSVLVLSQLFVLFTGMAGRVGFNEMTGQRFRNRFFDFGHSGYFTGADMGEDAFMKNYWVDLLVDDQSILLVDERESSTVAGMVTFLLNNLEAFKLTIYIGPLVLVLLWVSGLYRGSMEREELARANLARSLALQADRALLEDDLLGVRSLLVRATRVSEDPGIGSYLKGATLLAENRRSEAAVEFANMINARLEWLKPLVESSHPVELEGMQRILHSTSRTWLKVADFEERNDYNFLLRIKQMGGLTQRAVDGPWHGLSSSDLSHFSYFGFPDTTQSGQPWGELLQDVDQSATSFLDLDGRSVASGLTKECTLEELQATLSEREAIVDFVRSGDIYYAFVVTRTSASKAIYIAGEKELEDAVNRRGSSYASFVRSLHVVRAQGGEWGRELLYELIWSKIEKVLGDGIQVVYVIPDGVISSVPFEALKPRDGDRLLNDYYFIYMASPAHILREQRRREWHRDSSFLLVGDPTFRRKTISGRNSFLVLPYSRIEVDGVESILRRTYPHANVATLMGEDATELAFRGLADTASLIHIATHAWSSAAVSSESFPSRSLAPVFRLLMEWPRLRAGLALADIEDGGGALDFENDGLLTAAEIADMNLACDLVVLSACSTAGTMEAGVGLNGLAGAFLDLGVSDLVVTLYLVGDESASVLMALFYEELLSFGNKSTAVALQRAKIRMIEETKFKDPEHWEAFVVYSSGRMPW